MELKLAKGVGNAQSEVLLIVPYGIETAYYWRLVTAVGELLIVPYGIETSDPHESACVVFLLIVPYGIETSRIGYSFSSLYTFNRTLWN